MTLLLDLDNKYNDLSSHLSLVERMWFDKRTRKSVYSKHSEALGNTYRMKGKIISDEAIAALYASQKYENRQGKEFLDNAPAHRQYDGRGNSSAQVMAESV